MDEHLVLQGLYLHLIRTGFEISVRDYLDALRALRSGYGLNSPKELEWLCQTLWARTEAERRALSILFDQFHFTSEEEANTYLPEGLRPHRRETDLPEDDKSRTERREGSGEDIDVEFVPSSRRGLDIPEAQVHSLPSETFILSENPLVPLRGLIIIWRRFKRSLRAGPGVDLDLDTAVKEQCRRGYLVQLPLVPERRNQARLVVLIDVSPSMVAWRSFNSTLRDSLRYGQLGHNAVYYFHNVPQLVLYEDERLTTPVRVEKLLSEEPGSTLLVVSDGGAARGGDSWTRARETLEFLSATHSRWQPVAWANPMPKDRWPGTTAARLTRSSSLKMLELNEDGLIEAIDYLRGRVPK